MVTFPNSHIYWPSYTGAHGGGGGGQACLSKGEVKENKREGRGDKIVRPLPHTLINGLIKLYFVFVRPVPKWCKFPLSESYLIFKHDTRYAMHCATDHYAKQAIVIHWEVTWISTMASARVSCAMSTYFFLSLAWHKTNVLVFNMMNNANMFF